MLNQIAQQKVQEVQQAVQQGEMTIQEATQEVNAITETLNQQREQLNNVNNNINTQESIANENNTFNMKENSYRGSHQIDNTNTTTLDKLDLNNIVQQIEEKKGALTKQDNINLEKLQKIVNNPNEEITIYRTSPVNELNNGDWVTIDKDYANYVKNQNGGEIYEYKVKSSDLNYPNNINELPSLGMLSSFQYNQNNNVEQKVENNQFINDVDIKKKNNIIEEKIKKYVEELNDFNTNIKINTDIINDNTIKSNSKESTIFSKAKDLFKNIGKKVFNNKNESIYVDNTDIKESIHKLITNPEQKKFFKENLSVFSELGNIIESAKELKNDNIINDNKKRTNYSDYKYYASNIEINGVPSVVEFDTRLRKGQSGKLERHFILERVFPLKKENSATGASYKLTDQFGTEFSHANNISQTSKNVNDTQYNMQQNQKNTINENKSDNVIKVTSKDAINNFKEVQQETIENNKNMMDNNNMKEGDISGRERDTISRNRREKQLRTGQYEASINRENDSRQSTNDTRGSNRGNGSVRVLKRYKS